jgi:soluble lytic murein transglycosylase
MALPRFLPPVLGSVQRWRWLAGSSGAALILLGLLGQIPAGQPSLQPTPLADADFAELRWQSRWGLDTRERNRARLLYALSLRQDQPQVALDSLRGLEQSYPLLAPYILRLRAEIAADAGDRTGSDRDWRTLLQDYPDSPWAADALIALGQPEQALARYPRANGSLAWILEQSQPTRAQLLLFARYGLNHPQLDTVLDRLLRQPQGLSRQDWRIVADALWKRDRYGEAADAYRRAPAEATQAYRIARGEDLGGDRTAAIADYRQFLNRYPQAADRSRALLHLARLTPAAAPGLLTQLGDTSSKDAPEALARLADLQQAQGQTAAAEQTRRELLLRFPRNPYTAEAFWEPAWQALERQQWAIALPYLQPIRRNDDPLQASRALYWIGKAQQALGERTRAEASFRAVLTEHPNSYYAWRSAGQLGLAVGSFRDLRPLTPDWKPPLQPARLPLPAGSAALVELHLLGLDRVARELWSWERPRGRELTGPEQFTEALLLDSRGDHLGAIALLSGLDDGQHPQLLARPDYWQHLYPLPFDQPIRDAARREGINPLLIAGLIRQESRFLPGIQSVVGATGLMQLMPETAAEVAASLGLSRYDLTDPVTNIRLGSRYFDQVHDHWQDNSLLAIASYNAGPGNVESWVQRFGLTDPDRLVEQIPFPETRDYVRSVLANAWNYLRLYGTTPLPGVVRPLR